MATPTRPSGPDLGALRIAEGQRRAGRTGRRLALLATALLLVFLTAAAAFLLLSHRAPLVDVAVAQEAAPGRAALLNASGYVTPRRRATIASKVTGRVTGIFVDEGMHVRQGEVLATLDESDAKRALESTATARDATRATIDDNQVQLKNAEVALRRIHVLEAGGAATPEALDNARTAVDSLKAKIELARRSVIAADARVREARQAVDNCVIRAPFEGIVISKDAQVGEMVSPVSAGSGFTRTGIATIVDMSSLEIEVDVNEAYIARVVPDQPVKAALDAYPDWSIPAKVRAVIPTADRQKATVKVRISFLKLDARILPDMGVKVTFLGDEPQLRNGAAAPVVLIPQGAVRDEDGRKVAFLVKDGHVERRALTLGGTRGADAEVVAGVTAGDTVVVKGPSRLRDGQAIAVKE
jgi:RND family efflux transporter MFP subunit